MRTGSMSARTNINIRTERRVGAANLKRCSRPLILVMGSQPGGPIKTKQAIGNGAALQRAVVSPRTRLPVDVGESRFEDITDWLPRVAVELN